MPYDLELLMGPANVAECYKDNPYPGIAYVPVFLSKKDFIEDGSRTTISVDLDHMRPPVASGTVAPSRHFGPIFVGELPIAAYDKAVCRLAAYLRSKRGEGPAVYGYY